MVFVGLILEVLGAILTVVLIGIFLLPIAGIVAFVGYVLFGIGLYSVGSQYNNGLTKIGGILVATLILGFIGLIMVYVGLGEVQKNVGTYGYTPQSGQSQLYQVGVGTLKDGVATFTVYSSQQLMIYSASLLGTQYYTNSVTPNTLNPGNNNVMVNFGNVSGLTQGPYTIRLTLSNGQNLDVKVNVQ
nr:DUF973 family protein [Sulfuracidifex tepidarius]